jgi:hypothetical protein
MSLPRNHIIKIQPSPSPFGKEKQVTSLTLQQGPSEGIFGILTQGQLQVSCRAPLAAEFLQVIALRARGEAAGQVAK